MQKFVLATGVYNILLGLSFLIPGLPELFKYQCARIQFMGLRNCIICHLFGCFADLVFEKLADPWLFGLLGRRFSYSLFSPAGLLWLFGKCWCHGGGNRDY